MIFFSRTPFMDNCLSRRHPEPGACIFLWAKNIFSRAYYNIGSGYVLLIVTYVLNSAKICFSREMIMQGFSGES
jgi:hypothetical protein